MNNKIVKIMSFLVVISVMSGNAMAATETIKLTTTNTGETGYEVTVITDDSADTMTLRLTGWPQTCTPSVGNSGIDHVGYNSKITTAASETGWTFLGNGQYTSDGFGKFSSDNTNSASDSGITSDLVFTIPDLDVPMTPNAKNHKVAVHIRLPAGTGCARSGSFWITDGPSNGEIPEFPTVALPVAAIIGLVFFFQHKKRKSE